MVGGSGISDKVNYFRKTEKNSLLKKFFLFFLHCRAKRDIIIVQVQKRGYQAVMKSLKELYQIGSGPSSSHTMAPEKIAKVFKKEYLEAAFKVHLYGSLAYTGKGHGTDTVLKKVLGENAEIIFDYDKKDIPHPNTLDTEVFMNGKRIACRRAYSLGGGAYRIEGEPEDTTPQVYPHKSFAEIKEYCIKNDLRLSDYVFRAEPEIREYLDTIWETMVAAIKRGLSVEGVLPGGLGVQRKAKFLYSQRHIDESPETRENRMVCSYAFAVAEENAAGGTIVTAPTCGSSGVLPSVLYYVQKTRNVTKDAILRGLAVAGLIGNIIKTNASVSGAECGCQAEIGSACAMAAGGLAEMFELGYDQIEYATEICIEHHLGLTCDPVAGLVQIPCIERNAVAAMRALNALSLADFLFSTRKVSLDTIIEVMYETGKDLSSRYRETSEAGMAKLYTCPENNKNCS